MGIFRALALSSETCFSLSEEDVSELEQASITALYAVVAMYGAAAVANFAAIPSLNPAASSAAAMSSLGQAASTTSQILSLQASYERRREDWHYQRRLAQADVGIAQQAVTVAQDRLSIAREERAIAGLQADHAGAVVNFLTLKFTNAELYDWIGDTLEQVYRWFLQQATATAQLAAAQLAPIELQRFRQTGVLPFATTLQMFDQEFPGHYLRLIKRVRTSVVALVPPSHGIRATLACTGSSRTVISGRDGPFETVVVRRDPQLVALSSAMNASGVFELDPQPELLMPFEGLGVETHWEFRMPRAANPIDYRCVADVLVTFEFTALHSFDLAEKVRRELGGEVVLDRPFSFRHELSDAWWDLHNPDQTATPMKVRLETKRADFSPNLKNLRIRHLKLSFLRAEGQTFEITVEHLRLSPKIGLGFGPPVEGSGATTDGVISTRQGSAGFGDLLGQEPNGKWELALPDMPTVRAWFTDEQIIDILLVVTYWGEAAPWPA